MTRINSKKKGNRFEREVCKFFQSWTGYEFSRVPQSGGLRWKNTQSITSDVICTDEFYGRRWPFSIECKSYKDIKFEQLLLEKKSCKITSFWTQAVKDSERANKMPLLIMKYNGMPKEEAFLVCNYSTHKLLKKYLKPTKPQMHLLYPNPSDSLFVYMLSQLKEISHKALVKEVRKLLKKNGQ